MCFYLSLCFPASHGPSTSTHKSSLWAAKSSREEIIALLSLWACQASSTKTNTWSLSLWLGPVYQGLFNLFFPVTGQVNEVTMAFSQPGYFLVSVDACSGKVTKKISFSRLDAKMEQYLKTGIPKRWARKITIILSTACAFTFLTLEFHLFVCLF